MKCEGFHFTWKKNRRAEQARLLPGYGMYSAPGYQELKTAPVVLENPDEGSNMLTSRECCAKDHRLSDA